MLALACGGGDDYTASKGTGGSSGKDSGTGGTSASGGSGNTSSGGASSGGTAGASVDGSAGAPSGGAAGAAGGGSGGVVGDGGPLTASQCFAARFVNSGATTLGPDYDQFNPVIGSHCNGTNHQNIQNIDKVVFLGDSVTVGTPPTSLNPAAVYRAILSQKLATLLNLTPPGLGWGAADIFNGVALPKESGDFISCAKWGARTDDLMQDSNQVVDCIPAAENNLHYLVIVTIGGNDIAAITQDGGGTAPVKTIPQLWADTMAFVKLLEDTAKWLKDPVNVPGGVELVFANMYEFTDGTGETNACALSSLGGIQPWTDVTALADMVIWANEQYMKIAVDTQSDMIFMLESFCGHGFKKDDPTGPCYRGANTPGWFDLTCIHPNNEGHAALADLFYTTVAE
jgi:hypothetical protein